VIPDTVFKKQEQRQLNKIPENKWHNENNLQNKICKGSPKFNKPVARPAISYGKYGLQY
jgi:hypothetical protein